MRPAAPSWPRPATVWLGNFPPVRAEDRREVAGLEVVELELEVVVVVVFVVGTSEELGCWGVSDGAGGVSELVSTSLG